jgi:hypothetical protein
VLGPVFSSICPHLGKGKQGLILRPSTAFLETTASCRNVLKVFSQIFQQYVESDSTRLCQLDDSFITLDYANWMIACLIASS